MLANQQGREQFLVSGAKVMFLLSISLAFPIFMADQSCVCKN